MQRSRLVVAIVLGLLGLAWLGQGLGLVPGSFMTGQTFWALAGVAALTAAIYLAWGPLRRR
jgi:uncharacterized membrane protein